MRLWVDRVSGEVVVGFRIADCEAIPQRVRMLGESTDGVDFRDGTRGYYLGDMLLRKGRTIYRMADGTMNVLDDSEFDKGHVAYEDSGYTNYFSDRV